MTNKPTPLTNAYVAGKQTVAIVQVGEQFKIVKKVINYVRGKNVESWRVMGSASTFTELDKCVAKFAGIVNKARISEGKTPINFKSE